MFNLRLSATEVPNHWSRIHIFWDSHSPAIRVRSLVGQGAQRPLYLQHHKAFSGFMAF